MFTPGDVLKTKPHFDILDGLRGIAALAVVIFHFMEWAYSDYSKNFIGHGFLAVDFFFCLSGFVIGYAYDDRMAKMGIKAFFTSRMIRLHPLVIAGSMLGLLSFLFDPFGGHPELYSAVKLILVFITSIFLIPFPIMPDRGFNLFGLNAPAWSLFWEYVANIVYALFLYKLSRRYLGLLLIIAAAALCLVVYQSQSLMGGWAKENFWDGGARIAYSFIAGLLIYRSGWIIKTKLGFPGMAVLLALAFIIPNGKWNWCTEPAVVLFYFPLLVALGAGATLTPRFKKGCILFGKISYPLYMTHYAALWMFGNYITSHTVSATQLFFIITAATIILLGVAYVIMIWYDMPIRTYLTEKRTKA